ncbi:MAG: hypothetical protein ACRBI6_11610 [Acidimicrobiales bacterium]
MQTLDAGPAYERLNATLWRSRANLERMEFLLEVQLMMLRDGRLEWQHQISELLDNTADAVSVADLEREVAVIDGVEAGIAAPGNASLRLIADAAPEPWSLIFGDHLVNLEAVVRRIADLRDRARTAIESGRQQLDVLATGLEQTSTADPVGSSPSPYGDTRQGSAGRSRAGSRFFDGRA